MTVAHWVAALVVRWVAWKVAWRVVQWADTLGYRRAVEKAAPTADQTAAR
jgi:hypothetical protein